MQSLKRVLLWEAAMGLLAAAATGTIAGFRTIAANAYLSEGLRSTALYAFAASMRHNTLAVLAIVAAVCAVSFLCLLSRNRARTAGLVVGLAAALAICYRLGYDLNRYDFKSYWLETRSFLGIPVRAALVTPQVVLANIGILALALLVGWLAYKIVTALFCRLERGRATIAAPFKPRWLVLAVAIIVLGFNVFCIVHRSINRHQGPNVLLISLDTLRADHLGCYGYERDTSPVIDRLASNSVVFEKAITQSGWTLPSHKSALTSLDPPSLRRGANRRLDPRSVTLAELMLNLGYSTAGFANGLGWVTPVFGFHQGFETYVVPSRRIVPQLGSADVITSLALSWLGKHGKSGFFLFLHYGDIHSDWGSLPYEVPEPYGSMFVAPGSQTFESPDGEIGGSEYLNAINEGRFDPSTEEIEFIEALYDGGIRYTDLYIGELIEGMKELGILDNTLLIIFSDHGEEFREHGKMLHGWVYRETAHVPLIMRFPEPAWSGQRIDAQVRLLDIVPTVLDYMGIPIRDEMRGESLLSMIQEGGPPRTAFTEGGDTYAVRSDGWMFLQSLEGERRELYNLLDDPSETEDLYGRFPAPSKKLAMMLGEWLSLAEANKPGVRGTQAVKLDRKTQELLKSLGYLHTGP